MNSQRILIAEELAIFRAGLRALLAHEPGLEVVAEAGTGDELVALTDLHQPDLILMDLCVEPTEAPEVIETLKQRHPPVKIVILTAHKRERYVRAALRAGADAYVLKEDRSRELFSAIRSANKGKIYLSPGLGGKSDSGYSDPLQRLVSSRPIDIVTECVLEGMSAREPDSGFAELMGPNARLRRPSPQEAPGSHSHTSPISDRSNHRQNMELHNEWHIGRRQSATAAGWIPTALGQSDSEAVETMHPEKHVARTLLIPLRMPDPGCSTAGTTPAHRVDKNRVHTDHP